MTLRVEHRKDGLLERTAMNDVPFDLRQTQVGRLTWPVYQALYWFLTDKVMVKTYENTDDLQATLNTWANFCNENGMGMIADYPVFVDAKGTAVRFPEMGGWASEGMIIATITEEQTTKPRSESAYYN
jgi:hypothetical protein